jgi:RNA polymerase sigma-70 factor (ECF subfamily)
VDAERDLVEAARQGERDAYVVLIRPRVDRLYAIALRVLRDADRADDAVQDALVLAWRDLRSLREADRFDAWLQRIVLNACMRELRSHRRREARVVRLTIDAGQSPDELSVLLERDRMEQAFRNVSVDQRVVLALRHYLGYSPDEIAEALDIPVGTAKSRLHYAHRAMRAALEAEGRAPALGEGQA